jgi:hypothetical protein
MENAQLTLTDLASIHQLIDTAASRGAFRAAEMQQVGEIYNKLTAFLSAVASQQSATASDKESTESTTEPQGEKNA